MSEEQQSEVKTQFEHLKSVRPPVFKKNFSVEETNAELNRYNSEIDTATVQAQLQRAEELKPPDDASLGAKLGYSLSFNTQVSELGKPQVDGEVLQSAKASRETTTTSITPSLKRELTSNISATSDSFFRGAVPETVFNEAVGKVRPEPPSERQLEILASRPEDYSQPSDVSVKRNAVSVKPLDKTTEDENVMNGKRPLIVKQSGDDAGETIYVEPDDPRVIGQGRNPIPVYIKKQPEKPREIFRSTNVEIPTNVMPQSEPQPPSQQELLSTGVEVPSEKEPTKKASQNVTGGGKKRRKKTKKKKKSKKRKTKRRYKTGKRN